MNHTEIVKKLVGNIQPAGESHTDKERFENLKDMCLLVDNLVSEIVDVSKNKDRYEHSMKEMGLFANKFLNEMVENITN